MKILALTAAGLLALTGCEAFRAMPFETKQCLVGKAILAAQGKAPYDGDIDIQGKLEMVAADCEVDLNQFITDIILVAMNASLKTEAGIEAGTIK